MPYTDNFRDFPQVWEINNALDEFKELLIEALKQSMDMFPKINDFIESGKSAFVISKFDTSRTKLTGKIFVTYQLADELKDLLDAAKTNKKEN